ncbi:2378_t:CDS:2, partial [Entrophospora sp. SA101]
GPNHKIAREWNKEHSHRQNHLHQPKFTSGGINNVNISRITNSGTFVSGLSKKIIPKRSQEEDNAESVEIIDDSKNDTESIDIKHGEEEIRRLSLDEIDIRNKLLAILTSQQKEDKKSGKDCVSSISLNHIIDSSNNEVFKQVNNTLNESQTEWLNMSFVPKGSFNSYHHETHDIMQQILTHFSVCLEAPMRIESNSLDLERTYAIDTTVYILNRLFRMHQDVVDNGWIELTTPDTKNHKIDGPFKIDVLSTIKAINKEPTGDNNIHITSVQNTPAKKRNDKNQPLPSSSKSPSPGSPLQRSDLFSYLE